MGWDIAAGIAILKTAGGKIRKLNLKELVINKKTFINDPFVCYGNNFNSGKLKLILKQF
jgi:3'-phosphoadenosine 5'-phosphosulfate (PAPS) 3'-phosphatase